MTTPQEGTSLFELISSGIRARAELRNGQFVVLAGSTARLVEQPSFAGHSYAAQRASLIAGGQLMLEESMYRFAVDVAFNRSSGAAAVALGRTANGKAEWKTPDGQSYGEWLAAQGRTELGVEEDPAEITSSAELPPFAWKPFFHELAVRLLDYEDRQAELLGVLHNAGIAVSPDEGEPLDVMDPFTFFSLILKHKSEATALALLSKVGTQLGINVPVPNNLTGVPWSNPMNTWFFSTRLHRQEADVPRMWALARQTVAGDLDPQTFADALKTRNVALPKLTQGLFWLNPDANLALNGVNVPYLQSRGILRAGQVRTLSEYQTVLEAARAVNPNLAALSHTAWLHAQQSNQTATLEDNHFPFTRFQTDAAQYASDRVKGNLVLDRRYAPLLLRYGNEKAVRRHFCDKDHERCLWT